MQQRDFSWPSTRSSVLMDIHPLKLSMRLSKRLPSLFILSSARRGKLEFYVRLGRTLTLLLISMDYMYHACSTTARRGALDWAPIFEKANTPVFEKLYQSVRDGTETRRALEFNGKKTYREDLARELAEIDNQEMWRAGKTVRSLRPDAQN